MIEAMVAAAILGIALLGLVRLHATSMKGTVKAQRLGRASEVARQLAETVASRPFLALPPCLPGSGPGGAPLPPGASGCRATLGPSTLFALPKAAGCTVNIDGAAVQDVSIAGPTPNVANSRCRVDTAISQHPGGNINYPNTAVVTVWVCWTEPTGLIREISTSRMVAGGL
jgi:hypothetical protein